MLIVVLALQILILIVLVVGLLRKPGTAGAPAASEDPRLSQLLAADLPAALARLDGRAEVQDQHLRAELSHMRADAATETARSRETTAADAERLRTALDAQLKTLAERFISFTSDTTRHHADSREALHKSLNELGTNQATHQEKLRSTMEERLGALNQSNIAKLEEMRATVDEKLQQTLHTRLTESFGAVTDQLTKVHAGLGEMNTLTTGVSDLNRIFSNVKSRGGFAEVQLGKLLDQVLAPGQYVANAHVRPDTQEVVEYAVRFPGAGGDVLLPIDAKFPREDWERLESAYEAGVSTEIEAARKAFDAAIRVEGKRICSKYINEPITTPYAIMFLPTEGLYAEVLRRDGLQADLHQNCRVMVAGPTNLYALLTSFQLGFKMLNLQKKGDAVWKELAATQTEFTKFGGLMDKMEKQVGTVQNTIHDLGVRTRAINRRLRDVGNVDPDDAKILSFDGVLPMLAATDEE